MSLSFPNCMAAQRCSFYFTSQWSIKVSPGVKTTFKNFSTSFIFIYNSYTVDTTLITISGSLSIRGIFIFRLIVKISILVLPANFPKDLRISIIYIAYGPLDIIKVVLCEFSGVYLLLAYTLNIDISSNGTSGPQPFTQNAFMYILFSKLYISFEIQTIS